MAAPGVATQLQKGEAFDIDESDGLICVSVGSSFSAASPAVTALALNGEEPLYVKVAPKMGGGDTGREKWNQNSYRDEMVRASPTKWNANQRKSKKRKRKRR